MICNKIKHYSYQTAIKHINAIKKRKEENTDLIIAQDVMLIILLVI